MLVIVQGGAIYICLFGFFASLLSKSEVYELQRPPP